MSVRLTEMERALEGNPIDVLRTTTQRMVDAREALMLVWPLLQGLNDSPTFRAEFERDAMPQGNSRLAPSPERRPANAASTPPRRQTHSARP